MFFDRIATRVTYSNVVATVALFASVGGASYAAVVLPANSVGTQQLKARAVTPSALGFPLGAEAFTDRNRQDLPKSRCGASMGAERCRTVLEEGVPIGNIHLRSGGKLSVPAIAEVVDEGPAGKLADVH